MPDPRFDRLTERQKICLRFVKDGHTTKEIADGLGISPNAVDKAIKAAMARIGVDRRLVAARALHSYEMAEGGQPLAPPTPALPAEAEADDIGASPDGPAAPLMVQEERAYFDVRLDRPIQTPQPDAVGTTDGDIRDRTSVRTTLGRIAWGAGLVALLLLVVCIAAVALSGATYFYQVSHHLRNP